MNESPFSSYVFSELLIKRVSHNNSEIMSISSPYVMATY